VARSLGGRGLLRSAPGIFLSLVKTNNRSCLRRVCVALVPEHDHMHEVKAGRKAPSIPMSLYFSRV